MVAVGALVIVGVKFTCDDQIRRFWEEIGDYWQTHERMLAEDPAGGAYLIGRRRL
jgi:hypothetical protein